MIFITATFLAGTIGVSVYLSTLKEATLSVTEQFPESKPHEHMSLEGNVVEHLHVYEPPSSSEVNTVTTTSTSQKFQHPWNRLNLAAIRRDYQKYTVAEMRAMWDAPYLNMYGGKTQAFAEADRAYPRDIWLARLLDLGHPFVKFSDYKSVLILRQHLIWDRESWEQGYAKSSIAARGLPPDTPWEPYEDSLIKSRIVSMINQQRALEKDSDFQGGVTFLDGAFIPFRPNTMHVHVSHDTGITKFTGVRLTQAQKNDLTNYGIAPKGITVVYVDEDNKPLPPGTPPRFYERRMKHLEKAQTYLQQQIEDHEALLELDALLNPPEEGKQTVLMPHDHAHDHDHTHETPQTPEPVRSQQRQLPDAKQPLPQRKMPPELHTPDAVNRWFTELEALHGGQLPKDLKELRKIIDELEKIRREGEAKLKPPQRPEHPAPDTAPPEGGSDAPPDKED